MLIKFSTKTPLRRKLQGIRPVQIKILTILCFFIVLLGCTNRVEQAKRNALAGMHMYEESQSLQGDSAVSAGLKWLFGVMHDTETVNKGVRDSTLVDVRNNAYHLLIDKYMLSKEQIEEIANISDDKTRDNKIESIYKPIADKINSQQKEEVAKQAAAREQQVANSIPQIGMTAKEVESSKWGTPGKINTTLTYNGKYEQWVYNNYRYVYLENGIVTSVQY